MGLDPTAFGAKLWCCGNLQTGSITVAVANIVCLILVSGHFIESQWPGHFGLDWVAFFLVALFFLAANAVLLHGAVNKQSWLLLPWLVLSLGLMLVAPILCTLYFQILEGTRAVLILGSSVQLFFFVIVGLHYLELRAIWQERDEANGQHPSDLGETRKNDCLIDLELEEKQDSSRDSDQDLSFNKNDDTFTHLASRAQTNGVYPATSGAASASKTQQSLLPTPDEVISLPSPLATLPTTDDSLTEVDSSSTTTKDESSTVIPRRSTAWKSSVALDGDTAPCHEPLLPPSKSESKILLAHVDNNFSPFRSKSAAQNGPKMKVFLPAKNSFEDDDNSSSSSEDEDEKSTPAKSPAASSNNA